MNSLVILGLTIYLLGMLGVGYYASKKVKGFDDYMVAGRRLGFGLATGSLVATWFCTGSVMGASGSIYSDGLMSVVSDPFAASLSLILSGLFYVGYMRRMKLVTVTEVFGIYYSKKSEIFASILMIPVYIGWLGSQMVAMGYIINTLIGMNITGAILLGSVIVLIYTYQGGMWADTLTDFVQLIFILIGLLLMTPIIVGDAGGYANILKNTPDEFLNFYPKNAAYTDWVPYIGQWVLMGFGCVVGQDLIQRSLSSKTEHIARASAITAGIIYLLMGFMPLIIGLAGRLLMPGVEDPEMLMPLMALKYLSPFMIVLFMGALVSALMSSADSSLLAGVSLITTNIMFRIKPDKTDAQKLKDARNVTIILAIASVFTALWIQEIYDLMVNSWATLWVAIFAPVTFALYWKKANTLAAWVSMIAGTSTWLFYIFIVWIIKGETDDSVFYAAATYGGVVSILSYVITTFVRFNTIKPHHMIQEDAEIK